MPKNDFSLVNGGPLFSLLSRIGLIKPGSENVTRRIIAVTLLTWFPVLLLAAAEGLAWGSKVRVPFLLDLVAHTRFLLAVPLLIIAEIVVDRRVSVLARQFTTCGLVPADELPKYDSAVKEVTKLRDLKTAEVIMVVIAYAVVLSAVPRELTTNVGGWHVVFSDSTSEISLAGWWYAIVSIPTFQFLTYRWLWRNMIWAWFLWRMSRLKLQLVPTHADLAGGLGFLGISPIAFGIIPFAIGTVYSGVIAREIIFNGASLPQFKLGIATFIACSLILNFGPLLVFAVKLAITKRSGMLEYGALTTTHDLSFKRKWVNGENPDHDVILGNPDVSSLADMGSGYERVQNMRFVPIDLRTIIAVTATSIVPLLPLLLTMYPLDELLKKLLQIFV